MKLIILLLLTACTAWWSQSSSSGSWTLQGTEGPASPSGSGLPVLTSIAITPSNPEQIIGFAVALTATGTYSDGSNQNLTTSVTWSSGNSSVASIGALSTTQLFTCVAPGTSVISATLTSVTGTTSLNCQSTNLQTVALPTTWVNTHECDTTLTSPNQTIAIPSSGTGGTWTGGGPYTANSQSSLNQALIDAESYRNVHQTAGKVLINIPAGALYSGSNSILLPQTAGDTSSNCIALVSTGSLNAGVTACAHGTQDNLPGSSNVGVRNQACNASGANDVAQMWTAETTAGNTPALKTGAADANGVGPHHYLIEGMEAREQAGNNATIAILVGLGTTGSTLETLLSQLPSHIYIDRSWLHGDITDALTGSNIITHMLQMNCYICGATNSQWSQSEVGGQQNQAIYVRQGQGLKIVNNWFDGPGQNFICGGADQKIPNSQLPQQCVDVEYRRNRLSYPAAWLGAGKMPDGQNRQRIAPFELKSGLRILVDGNIMENVDDSGAQWRMFGLNPKAYNNSSPQYFIDVADITMTNNIFRHVCTNSGGDIADRSSAQPNGNGVSLGTQRVNFINNLGYDINKPAFCSSLDNGGYGLAFSSSDTQFTACTAQRDSLGQTSTLTCVNSGTGMAQTDTNIGDPIAVRNCVDSTFNVGGTDTAIGPPALAGTDPNGLTIVYANPGTANATTTGCTFDNFEGYPKSVTFAHNTIISSGGNSGVEAFAAGSLASGSAFMQNATFADNIVLGGILGQGLSDTSTPTSQAAYWDLNTAVWHHNLMPGRTCTKWVDILTAGGTPISPPTTSLCPTTAYCAGSDPTVGSCVGMAGLMSASSINVNLTDWHGYRLCHAGDSGCANPSIYSAGQAGPASDGSDRGVNFPNIDSAQTQTRYTCSNTCGSGPFPD